MRIIHYVNQPIGELNIMVKIRLARIGRKALPSYRIVVSDSRRTPHGSALVQLGSFDPIHNTLSLNAELALEWLNKGALPSDSVKTLLKKDGVYAKFVAAKVEASRKPAEKKAAKKPAAKKTAKKAPAAASAEVSEAK